MRTGEPKATHLTSVKICYTLIFDYSSCFLKCTNGTYNGEVVSIRPNVSVSQTTQRSASEFGIEPRPIAFWCSGLTVSPV